MALSGTDVGLALQLVDSNSWIDEWTDGWLAGWGLQCVRMYGYRLCGPWTARHGGLKASTTQEDEETRGKKTG